MERNGNSNESVKKRRLKDGEQEINQHEDIKTNLQNSKENNIKTIKSNEHSSEEEEEEDNETQEEKIKIVKDIYLDTIDRTRLDFDFEKICCISNSNFNIYACLICGKFFQGKGKSTQAYFHSIDEDHHVFINLSSLNVYILPDDHLVEDPSLNDIKYVIKPTFTKEQVYSMVYNPMPKYSFDLNNKKYLPGYVGLNNIQQNDYMNVILQALIHIPPIRDYFLLNEVDNNSSQLIQKFSLLCRKIYNPQAFKGQVSPHEVLQEISYCSKKEYRIEKRKEPIKFLAWFLNQLHLDMGGSKKRKTIISNTFRGIVQNSIYALEDNLIFNLKSGESKIQENQFFFLSIELPPPPLFQDSEEKNIIPQVSIANILSKFDGKTEQESSNLIKKYKILELPPYLIVYYKRFNKNNFNFEKNPTIVTFPINQSLNLNFINNNVDKYYNLLVNVVHENSELPENGNYLCYLKHPGLNQWFKVNDLNVDVELSEMIPLTQSYLQIWELKDNKYNKK
ncbi:cysteine proteinase [Neoconidiobolus thromboides FSU 785]|nr:cysteine proteinase [Neoconidiobolus thromboides FSU 785]